MINNIELIKELLNFTDEHDFYMLYILKRKKDQPEGEKDNHQSVRTIKTYQIKSLEYLDKKMSEIIDLCEMFKARAYVHINKHNHKDVSLLMMERLAQRIRSGVVNQAGLFDTIVGEMHSLEKRWVIDIDTKDRLSVHHIGSIINSVQPSGDKILAEIPTRNGSHLITKAFNIEQFSNHPDQKLNPDIQKKNPTLLFYPNSLD
jgi:hypothetical protein